jgi:hypothetical protein
MLHRKFSQVAFVVGLLTLAVAVGCRNESGPEGKEKPAAGFRQVTVDLTGMT